MSAFIIFTREKTLDQSQLEVYWREIHATFIGHQVKILANYGCYEVLEGDATEGVVIAEFSSMDTVKAWYDSPAYQKVRKHRLQGAVYRGIAVEGV